MAEDVEFYDGSDVAASTKRFSIGLSLDRSSFVIRDEVAEEDRFSIDASGSVSVSGFQAALLAGEAAISGNVITAFAQVEAADGVGYGAHLVTAKALWDWLEIALDAKASLADVASSTALKQERLYIKNSNPPQYADARILNASNA